MALKTQDRPRVHITVQALLPHLFTFLWFGFGSIFLSYLIENGVAKIALIAFGNVLFLLVLGTLILLFYYRKIPLRRGAVPSGLGAGPADGETPSQPSDWINHSKMPIAIANKFGSIIQQNPAFQNLVGHQVNHLDRVMPGGLFQADEIQTISTQHENLFAYVTVHLRDDGLQEIHISPCQNQEIQIEVAEPTLEVLPVALVKISLTGHVILANRMARHLLGHSMNSGIHFDALVKGLGRSVEVWLHEAMQGKSQNKPEVVEAKNTTSEVYLQITLSRITENGETYLLAVLNDATELKTLEAQFVQSQKMQAIGQLAGGIAHDFNNLLTAISGYTDLLLLRHESDDPEYGDLIQISQNANRAASLAGQLLAFSRKQSLQMEVLDLRDILSEVNHLLNRLLPDHISLSVEDAPKLRMIRADKRQLEQVIMNLVVNSRDAMHDGGVVQIATDNLYLAEDISRDRAVIPKGDYVSITVTDTGSGIPEDKLPKIFEPFFTTKRVGEGTGLGLSTAYGIIKQTSGFIFAKSAVGVGTEFTILLPAYAQPTSLPLIKPQKSPPKKLENAEGVILLVEDEAPVRNFAARALRMKGFTVLEADCAEDALGQLENEALKVDVFVTDVIMPGMDGPAWVRQALKQRPNVKVVFISGYAEDFISENKEGIPNSVFLPKPYTLNDLTATVNEQLC